MVYVLRALLVLAAVAIAPTSYSMSCLDESGAPVDTWLILKGPRTTSYLYADSTTPLQPSMLDLNSTTAGALAYTASQIWSADTYALYNDQPPASSGYNFTYGHTKGMFFTDANGTGAWIQHSVPEFMAGPTQHTGYAGLEANAWENGQHIYCMTLDLAALDVLAYTLQLALPYIYDSRTGSAVAPYSNITQLLAGAYRTDPQCTATSLRTVGGTEHILFGKSTQWNNELWAACVAPTLRTNLMVQSWLHGTQTGPYCPATGYTVRDVKELDYGGSASWDAYYDHSKWGVGSNVSCFGDINRVTTQASRGGGAVCSHTTPYAEPLGAAVQDTNSC